MGIYVALSSFPLISWGPTWKRALKNAGLFHLLMLWLVVCFKIKETHNPFIFHKGVPCSSTHAHTHTYTNNICNHQGREIQVH